MKKLLVKKNTTIKTPLGRAELYYQTVFADHLVENFQKDLQVDPAKRHHDLIFSDIGQLLRGNVSMKVIAGKEGQIEAVSFYRGRHYFTCFHVAKRPDSDTRFAFIVTCYATNEKKYLERYQRYIDYIKENFGNTTR
ncbi:hypothetical protein J2I47_17320 [Fibrella sp. HMF5335]|uniref:Uncharacterized protein n=1 Tax=Fibrella rubiginis TaxID=2817060 RepID=A0A939GIZ3_9BACT|nr:hypothetical protein [Fibrella rubiginis]MBO0938315.1 hypothetical protein [Fibrella rubiginis]